VRGEQQHINQWWGTANSHGSDGTQGRVDYVGSRLDKKLSLVQPSRTYRTEEEPNASVVITGCNCYYLTACVRANVGTVLPVCCGAPVGLWPFCDQNTPF
jgi:hypothetical protein